MKNFLSGKICLTLVIIQNVNRYWKNEFGGVIVNEFVVLKSKMYSVKNIDCKECNAAKGVSIATEFDKFKDVLFNEKIIRHKIKKFKVKSINWEIMKLPKYLCHVLTIKDMC